MVSNASSNILALVNLVSFMEFAQRLHANLIASLGIRIFLTYSAGVPLLAQVATPEGVVRDVSEGDLTSEAGESEDMEEQKRRGARRESGWVPATSNGSEVMPPLPLSSVMLRYHF